MQRLFPLLAEGKSAEAAALLADSVSFSVPHPPGIPWLPEVDSAEGMRRFFELLQTHAQAKEFGLRQVIAEGPSVPDCGVQGERGVDVPARLLDLGDHASDEHYIVCRPDGPAS